MSLYKYKTGNETPEQALRANIGSGGQGDSGGMPELDYDNVEIIWSDFYNNESSQRPDTTRTWIVPDGKFGRIIAYATGTGTPHLLLQVNGVSVGQMTGVYSIGMGDGLQIGGFNNFGSAVFMTADVAPGQTVKLTACGIRATPGANGWNYRNEIKFIPYKTQFSPLATEMAWIADYTNIETTNRINAVGGSWTADRDGFVLIGGQTNTGGTLYAKINGMTVPFTTGTPVFSNTVAGTNGSQVFSIKKGDTITLSVNGAMSGVWCYFIPPVAVVPPTVDTSVFLNNSPVMIATGTDLNTVNQLGFYNFPATVGATLLNSPTALASTLLVEVRDSGFVKQTVTTVGSNATTSNRTWIRTSSSPTSWTDWAEVITTAKAGASMKHQPHNWVVGTEYDFGDGSFGQRFSSKSLGNLTAVTAASNQYIGQASWFGNAINITLVDWDLYLAIVNVSDSVRIGTPATASGAVVTTIHHTLRNSITDKTILIKSDTVQPASSGITLTGWVIYTK